MQLSSRPFVVGAFALAAVAVLAGCSSGGTTDSTSAATTTRTVTATPSAPSSPVPSSSVPSTSAGSSSSGGDAGSGAAGGRCATSDLTGSIEPGSGGAAGSVYVHLVLTNTGATSCTLQGWPGVSFVGGGDGAQIGAAASQDQASAHPTVTLAPGRDAVAPLKIGQAADRSAADCSPRTPDGFRVYPPGSKQSLFVADTDQQACANTSAPLLSVQALVPPGQATS